MKITRDWIAAPHRWSGEMPVCGVGRRGGTCVFLGRVARSQGRSPLPGA